MGIGDRGILAVGQSVEETTKEMLAQLVDEESELISLYFGQDVWKKMRKICAGSGRVVS